MQGFQTILKRGRFCSDNGTIYREEFNAALSKIRERIKFK